MAPSRGHYPHRIRLRGPWECEPLFRTVVGAGGRVERTEGPLPPPCRMTIPCRWQEGSLADFAGRVRFRRHFGYPGRIDSYERVWLTFAGVAGVAEGWLNGRFLGQHEGASEPFEFEVTGLLGPRNELAVEVEARAGDGGLYGEVALEVRRTAFLRDVRLWATGQGETAQLHVAGEVVGTSERPLELYVILDRSTVAYTTVEPTATGRPFQLAAAEINVGRQAGTDERTSAHLVRIDLVDGAVVWYRLERSFDWCNPLAARGK